MSQIIRSTSTSWAPLAVALTMALAGQVAADPLDANAITLGRVGEPRRDSEGGPDGAGYRWWDQNEPEQQFQWYDIRQNGQRLEADDDWISGALQLGFVIPWYGQNYEAIRVCSNGWVTFDLDYDGVDAELPQAPDASAPNNVLIPNGCNLNPEAGGAIYFYTNNDDRAVVSWESVPVVGVDSSAATFQVVILTNGTVKFGYRAQRGVNGAESNIGFESPDGENGLSIAYHRGGALPGQGSGYRIARIWNRYEGAAAISVEPDAIDFGRVQPGAEQIASVVVVNVGSEDLSIDALLCDDQAFAVPELNEPVVVASAEQWSFDVAFNPPQAGDYASTVNIRSDAVNGTNGLFAVPVHGIGLAPPAISLEPDSIVEELHSGDSSHRDVTVINSGDAPLVFRIQVEGLGEDPWLVCNPWEGEVGADDSAGFVVDLAFNAEGLNEGEYHADLHFLSNDPANPDAVVNVVMNVLGWLGPPELDARWAEELGYPDVIDWDRGGFDLFVGNEVPVTLQNVGASDLEVGQIWADDSAFSADRQNFTIAPNEEAVVDFILNADQPGFHQSVMRIAWNSEDGEDYTIPVQGTVLQPPVIVVQPEAISENLEPNESRAVALTVGNQGGARLRFLIESEAIPDSGRDGERSARALRNVNGVAPRRDDAGDILAQHDIPYPAVQGLAWDSDRRLVWGNCQTAPNALFAFDPAQGQIVHEFAIPSNRADLTYWDGLLYINGWQQAPTNILVFDTDGNQVGTIQLPFSLFRKHIHRYQDWLFVRAEAGYGDSHAVLVYQWGDWQQIGRIPDLAETGDTTTFEIEWVPGHRNGQLWVDGLENLYQLRVDEDWNCELVQQFAVENRVRAGLCHDGQDLWRAANRYREDDHVALQRIDDGVEELYWLAFAPAEGEVEAGGEMNITVTLSAGAVEGRYEANLHFLSNDPSTPDLSMSVEMNVSPPPETHTLLVTAATFDDNPIPTGWEVGVFTPAGLLAGVGVWVDGDTLSLAAVGDDPNTEEVDGFRAGEAFRFRLWNNQNDLEFAAAATISDGPDVWTANALTALSLAASSARDLRMDFNNGWNLISINVTPPQDLWRVADGPDVILMMNRLRYEAGADSGRHHVVLMKDERGRFYAPFREFNNIPFWNLTEGYQVRVDQAISTVWSGAPIPFDADVPISRGWNFIAYFPTYQLSCSSPDFYAISSILDNVVLVKDGSGRFAIPSRRFSNMIAWREGQGYQINVNADVTLNYPAQQGQMAAMPADPELSAKGHWAEPASTGRNMSVLLTITPPYPPLQSRGGEGAVRAADQVAAFTAGGMLVGVGTVSGGMCGLAVWGDDPSTETVDGLAEGEAFVLKLWDAEQNAVIGLGASGIQEGAGLVYTTDAFTALVATAEVGMPSAYYLVQNYPNPFNAVTRLSFGLPDPSRVTIRAFDVAGRVAATLVSGELRAGHHSVVWNGEGMTSGIYLVKMEASGFTATRKVMLVK